MEGEDKKSKSGRRSLERSGGGFVVVQAKSKKMRGRIYKAAYESSARVRTRASAAFMIIALPRPLYFGPQHVKLIVQWLKSFHGLLVHKQA